MSNVTRLKSIYNGMKDRCCNSKSAQYATYGGRGIKICDEWLKSYSEFESWALDNGYEENLSIDRINVNGDYEPLNCRWVDHMVQANNKRHYWLPKDTDDFVYEGVPDYKVQEEKRDEIRHRLRKYQLSQIWLINQLAQKGLYTDKTEMSSVLAGTRIGAKSEYILNMSIEILDLYQNHFVERV